MSPHTRYWRTGLLALAAATAIACTGAPSSDGKPLTADKTAASTAAGKPPSAYAVPVAADFALTVKVLEKECFGSAGCNIKYRMVIKQVGAKKFDPAKTYEVTYALKGTEEPVIGTLTVTGDEYNADEYNRTDTKTSKAVITAVITDISES
jgi:hypothetical protein